MLFRSRNIAKPATVSQSRNNLSRNPTHSLPCAILHTTDCIRPSVRLIARRPGLLPILLSTAHTLLVFSTGKPFFQALCTCDRTTPKRLPYAPNTTYPAPRTGYCIAATRHPCPRKQSPNTAHPAPRTGYCVSAARHPCPRKQSPNTAHPAPHTGYCIAAARHPCEHPAWTYGITTPHAG